MSKDALRSQLLTLRDGLSPARREAFNQRISEYLIEMLPQRPLRIGSYMAYGSEVDLDTFHRQVFGGAHELLIPRILSKTTMEMVTISARCGSRHRTIRDPDIQTKKGDRIERTRLADHALLWLRPTRTSVRDGRWFL